MKRIESAVVAFAAAAILIAFAAVAILSGCKLETAEPDFDQQSAFMKLSNAPTISPGWYDRRARDDFVILSLDAWSNPNLAGAADSLRARNPKIVTGTYWPVFSLASYMRESPPTSYAGRLWAAATPFLAQTTEGDTAAVFLNAFVWDITNAKARARVVAVLADYARETGIGVAMLDFMSVPIPDLKVFQDRRWQDMERGDLDFDRDGVGHWNDQDEQAATRQAFVDYVAELRRAMPAGFRLVPNGSLALEDVAFSHLVDGCYIEGFPRWFYGSGDDPNYLNAMDAGFGPAALPNVCAPGRFAVTPGIVFLEDRFDRGDLSVVAAMFDGAVEMRRARDGNQETPQIRDLTRIGRPDGPAVIADGVARRGFAKGKIGFAIAPDGISAIAIDVVDKSR
jgi:hypothetical protein